MNRIVKNELARVEPNQNIQSDESISADIIWEPSAFYQVIKRCTDIILAAIGILVLLPLFLLIGLSIKLSDGGPILYFREIVGLKGRRFYALKFRTMIVEADSYLQNRPKLLEVFQEKMKLERDPRITRVGKILRKASLDELPQLYNVILGQMALVGPRIIHPSELSRYSIYSEKRLSVKPGITGLWQISGRQHGAYEERIVLDMQYIDKRSIMLDFVILIRTLKVFIVHTGE